MCSQLYVIKGCGAGLCRPGHFYHLQQIPFSFVCTYASGSTSRLRQDICLSDCCGRQSRVGQIDGEEGVKPRRDASGALPLDSSLMKALESYAVSFTLLPLPQQKKPSPATPAPKPKAAVKTTHFQKTSKGKGKSKGSSKGPRVPYQIIQAGGVGKTPDGSNICFKYNIEGCDEAADGSSCRRGKHCCAKCFASHSLKDHS